MFTVKQGYLQNLLVKSTSKLLNKTETTKVLHYFKLRLLLTHLTPYLASTLIPLFRYFTIVCGQEGQHTKRRVLSSISVLWFVSALTTTPIFYYQVINDIINYV